MQLIHRPLQWRHSFLTPLLPHVDSKFQLNCCGAVKSVDVSPMFNDTTTGHLNISLKTYWKLNNWKQNKNLSSITTCVDVHFLYIGETQIFRLKCQCYEIKMLHLLT